MNVSITEIVLLSDGKYQAAMAIDELTIETEIIEDSVPIRSFNFSNRAFKDVLEMAGQMTRFLKDYWKFRDDGGEPLPWDYGSQEANAIEKALRHHGLRH